MNPTPDDDLGLLPPVVVEQIDQICDRFEAAWLRGDRPDIESFLDDVHSTVQPALFRELLALELACRRRRGERPQRQDYHRRFPVDAGPVDRAFDVECDWNPPSARLSRVIQAQHLNTGANLLFGILALQNNFVDSDSLLAAFNAWFVDKTRPLGRILVELGALDRARHDRLCDVVQKHLKLHDGDAEKSLADLRSFDSLPKLLETLGRGDVQGALTQVLATVRCGPEHRDSLGRESCSTGFSPSRFRILRLLDRGGLGEVFVARDEELKREVALKQIQEEHSNDPERRSRFLLEGEITGSLEHPGIVPIYGMGVHDDGRPYYAMRFIRGESLKAAIARFHSNEIGYRDTGVRSLALRQLLKRFVDACNALEYAHSRGVLHRDIKPSNIMLGPYGETLVVDWGLAKVIGHTDEAAGTAEGEAKLEPEQREVDYSTLPGLAIGTPSFMSPEQATGNLHLIGPASDVYSLGATLYCLLTGRAPFTGRQVFEILRKVAQGDFAPPRRVVRSVPKVLEAICLKAMSLEQGDRYVTVRAMADDVEHWMADQPVLAYRERWNERLARWSRSHRAAVRAWMATLLLVTLASVVATIQVAIARRGRIASQRESKIINAFSALTKGTAFCNLGLTGSGIVWMARALKEAPDDAALVRSTIRDQIDSWLPLVHPLRTCLEARDDVLAVAMPPDGRWALTASAGNVAQLWNIATGAPLGRKLEHHANVSAVAVSPDGKWALTGSADGKARLWDVTAGEGLPLGPELDLGPPVHAVAFSPGSRYFVTASGKNRARIWETANGQPKGPILRHDARDSDCGDTCSVAFSPDEKTLLTAVCNTARLWSTADGSPIGVVMQHEKNITAAKFSPDGTKVLTCGDDTCVKLWRASDGTLMKESRLEESKGVLAAAFSPDGSSIVVGCVDALARLLDSRTDQPVAIARFRHEDSVRHVAISPDGQFLVTGSDDGSVRLWNTKTGEQIGGPLPHPDKVTGLQVNWSHRSILTACADGTARLWELAPIVSFPLMFKDGGKCRVAAINADGTLAFTGGGTEVAQLWEIPSGRPIGKPLPQANVLRAVFSSDGRKLLTGDADQHMQLWDAWTGEPTGPPIHLQDPVADVGFMANRPVFVTTGNDGAVQLWDERGNRRSDPFRGIGVPSKVAMSDDGTVVAIAGADDKLRLWNTQTHIPLGTPIPCGRGILAVAFSADARTVLTGGTGGIAQLWSVQTGKRIGAAVRHEGQIERLVTSRSGRLAASGDSLGRVRVWDTETGQLLRQNVELGGNALGVLFGSDGKSIMTVDEIHGARLWYFPTPVEGNADQIELWVSVTTNLEIRTDETLAELGREQWHRYRREIDSTATHSDRKHRVLPLVGASRSHSEE
jgi:WD40 repeat protein/serine/threonine protein kinase